MPNLIAIHNVQKLIKITKPKVWLFAWSIGLTIAASIFEVLGVGLLIPIVNSLASKGDFLSNLTIPYLGRILKAMPFQSDAGIFAMLMLLILASVGFSNLLLLGNTFCASKFITDIAHSLRTHIFARYLSFGKEFHNKSSLGALLTIMVNNTSELTALLDGFRSALVNLIMAAVFLIFLFFISWKLTLLALPLAFIISHALNWLVKKTRASAFRQYNTSIDLHSYSADVLRNAILVKAYTNEEYEYDKFCKKSNEARFHTFNVLKKAGAVPLFSDVVASIGFLIIVFSGVLFCMKPGVFPVGRFMIFFYSLRRFISYSKPINDIKTMIARANPLINGIASIFDDTGKAIPADGILKMDALKERIDFKNVSFQYTKERPVIKNISFTIKKGQTVAIIGPTGSGKTTIANLLCRFYDCDSGAIEIDGINLRDITLRSLRANIALVAQDTSLFNSSIGSNMVYGMRRQVSRDELDSVAKKAQIYEFIISLPKQYDTDIGDKGIKLSGGERQRIAISRAILKNADILILDEATSSLDSETERLFQKALSELTLEKTVIAIAHRLSTIKNADWIIVLENGEIAEQGSLEDLLEKKGRFFYYWNLQKFY